jgi:hypothetical protein
MGGRAWKETILMTTPLTNRRGRAPLIAAATISCLLATASPAFAQNDGGMFFDGASFGPTIEVAVQGAIWDAETSASAYQLFTCELVGEPQIFPGPNPEWQRNFSAQVRVFCTP